jgi:3-deoxy-manno-octulosonate cytidylyltransferase (CMP-KDO synthetase)
MAEFGIVIPARFGSARLPGKPLRDLGGKPLIVRVWENALRAGAAFVWVATDDERVARAVEQAGGVVVMTREGHASGTDRLAEVAEQRGLADSAIVVNVQGDEPLLDPAHVRLVAEELAARPGAGIATVAAPIHAPADLFDPSVVKVVLDSASRALLFSRAPLPWIRDRFRWGEPLAELPPGPTFLRHVGLYAYTAATLRRLAATPAPAIEQAESLEQLRALFLGIAIHVCVTAEAPEHGVDTPEDLARMAELFRAGVRGP